MIINIRHPEYVALVEAWSKWRLTYTGGDEFIDAYLKQYTTRETFEDFTFRKNITYLPAFAKAAIEEIRKAINTRANDIRRVGGSTSYKDAICGLSGGVDLQSTSMNSFVGESILSELLPMKRVGVYIDNYDETRISRTKVVGEKQHPYLYLYKTEDILSWKYDNMMELESVLLRNTSFALDKEFGLPTETEFTYKLIRKSETGITADEYDEAGKWISHWNLAIKEIPFIIIELNKSLLEDVANYQIAMLNVASSDINFLVKANFPFYVEQYDPRAQSTNLRRATATNNNQPAQLTNEMSIDKDATKLEASTAKEPEVSVGVSQGRRYPLGAEAPSFINPSAEPLQVSMEKQEAMKKEIRQLVSLSLNNIVAKMASAESKSKDDEGLIYGVASIAQVLECAERRISYFWHLYEGSSADTMITYPRQYNIQSEEDRNREAKVKRESMVGMPSNTYKKEMAKDIAQITLGHKVSPDVMDKIIGEIDSATIMNTDPKFIIEAHEAGLVGDETASVTIGFPSGEAAQAGKDHAERLARIQASQTSPMVQGINQGKKEAKDMKILNQDGNTNLDNNKQKVRGEA